MRSLSGLLAGCLLAAPGAVTLPLLTAAPVRAQEPVPYSSVRAINVARTAAVKLNGGLSVYRPAQCMFETARAENPCLVARNEQGYTFRFLGGAPGWQQLNLAPTVETEIRVSADGRTVLGVDYNGAPR